MNKAPLAQCDLCTLKDEPFVPSYGRFDAKLVVVGEAPGATEVAEGKPFVGPSGQLLNIAIERGGGDPEDTYQTNAVLCRPPGNRPPRDNEVAACRARLVAELRQTTGSIMTLGKTACEALGVPYTHKSAWIEWDKTHWLKPAWHPAYVLRDAGEANVFLMEVASTLGGPGLRFMFEPEVRIAKTLEALEEMLAECPDNAWVAFDIETDQVQWFNTPNKPRDAIIMLQVCWDLKFGVVADDAVLYDNPRTPEVLNAFFNRVRTVGHNAKFDCVFLKSHLGVNIQVDFDTMLAQYIIDETNPKGLKQIAKLEFGIPDYEEVLIGEYLSSRNDSYSKIPFDTFAEYGVLDVAVTLKLRELFEQRLRKEDQYDRPFMSPIMEASRVFTDVEIRGLKVDPERLESIAKAMAHKADELAANVIQLSGKPELNPGSPAQLAKVLYDDLKLPVYESYKIKARSTGHEALDRIRDVHPIVNAILDWRRVNKLLKSYVDNVRDIRDFDGRVHGTILIHGTEVGRLAIRNPALQTIPRPDDDAGALIRSMYCAGPGKVLVVADYSQAELRVMAHCSDEPFLKDAYINDRDLHSEVAKAMFGPGYTKAQRAQCKMFNFSYMYGGSEYSFAKDAGLPIAIAKNFVRDYNKNMPTALAWKRAQFQKMKTDGWVESVFHRRRHFIFITQDNVKDAMKASVHAVIAGTASDLTLISLIEIERDLGIPVVLTVHDSVICEVDGDVNDTPETNPKMFELAALVQQRMVDVADRYLPSVPWKADVEIRKYWHGGDCWVRNNIGDEWGFHPAKEAFVTEW